MLLDLKYNCVRKLSCYISSLLMSPRGQGSKNQLFVESGHVAY